MHLGLMLECDYRYGATEQEAFDEVFSLINAAEEGGAGRGLAGGTPLRGPQEPLGRRRRREYPP